MPPRESHKDKTVTKSSSNSSSSNSSEQIDSVFVGPTDQENDPEQATQTQPKNPRMKNTIFGYEMPFDVISTAFAGVVTLGGIMGYVKAKSVYSLAAGLVFGGILGVGAYLTSVNPRNYHLTLVTSAVLGSFMGYRAYNSGKFMPAGLIATLSLLMVLRFTYFAITDSGIVKNK